MPGRVAQKGNGGPEKPEEEVGSDILIGSPADDEGSCQPSKLQLFSPYGKV